MYAITVTKYNNPEFNSVYYFQTLKEAKEKAKKLRKLLHISKVTVKKSKENLI